MTTMKRAKSTKYNVLFQKNVYLCPEMKQSLSILIPTFNDDCTPLIETLSAQASQIESLVWEIVVGDDGSTDSSVVHRNRQACALPCCRYLRVEQNRGRAAIRNFLAQSAQYDTLLFLDCHVEVGDRFLQNYVEYDGSESVICGGVKAGGNEEQWKGNLRYRYERAAEQRHIVEERRKRPYQSFRTTNILVNKDTALSHPFDEQFRDYGYEDVLYGKRLKEQNVSIAHINNEVAIAQYESNERYVEKMEEALHTLKKFAPELEGYSRLLSLANRIESWHFGGVVGGLFGLTKGMLRRQLCGSNPSLQLFTAYRLGQLVRLKMKDEN